MYAALHFWTFSLLLIVFENSCPPLTGLSESIYSPTMGDRIAHPNAGGDSVAELAVGLFSTPPNFLADR